MPEPRETHAAIDARRNAEGVEYETELRAEGWVRREEYMGVLQLGKERTAERDALAVTIERLRKAGLGLLKSLHEVEERGDLYDAATHRWADLLHDEFDAAVPDLAAPSDPATDTGGEAT